MATAAKQQQPQKLKYLQERGVSVSGYLKTSLVEIASTVERMVLPVDPDFEKDQTTDTDKLTIMTSLFPTIFPEYREQLQLFAAVWVVRPFFNYFIFTPPITSCADNFRRTEYLRNTGN